MKNISELIDTQSDITINKVIENLNIKEVNETVRKAVVKAGYVYKKKSLCALLSVNAPDVAQKREDWIKQLSGYDKTD